jgi:hypothetical protein
MPDGRRKRRFSQNVARRRWYALHRSRRFCRRFGWSIPAWKVVAAIPATVRCTPSCAV